jgi:hypothetical protein
MKVIKSLLIASLFLGIIIYGSYKTVISNYLLKKNPTCIKAVIFDRLTGKTSFPVYPYSFTYQTEEYTGLAQEKGAEKLHIRDTVCVVFYKVYPSINKPLSYFDDGDIKCNCK